MGECMRIAPTACAIQAVMQVEMKAGMQTVKPSQPPESTLRACIVQCTQLMNGEALHKLMCPQPYTEGDVGGAPHQQPPALPSDRSPQPFFPTPQMSPLCSPVQDGLQVVAFARVLAVKQLQQLQYKLLGGQARGASGGGSRRGMRQNAERADAAACVWGAPAAGSTPQRRCSSHHSTRNFLHAGAADAPLLIIIRCLQQLMLYRQP